MKRQKGGERNKKQMIFTKKKTLQSVSVDSTATSQQRGVAA